MPNFALILVHGQHWDHFRGIRQQQQWSEHASFMDDLVADGFILLGGPLRDGARTLHVVEAADEGRSAAVSLRTRGLRQDFWRLAPSNPGHAGSTSGPCLTDRRSDPDRGG
jgi:hypothetical protein